MDEGHDILVRERGRQEETQPLEEGTKPSQRREGPTSQGSGTQDKGGKGGGRRWFRGCQTHGTRC